MTGDIEFLGTDDVTNVKIVTQSLTAGHAHDDITSDYKLLSSTYSEHVNLTLFHCYIFRCRSTACSGLDL